MNKLIWVMNQLKMWFKQQIHQQNPENIARARVISYKGIYKPCGVIKHGWGKSPSQRDIDIDQSSAVYSVASAEMVSFPAAESLVS